LVRVVDGDKAAEAKEMLEKSKLPLTAAGSLSDAARLIADAVKGN
jgi:succinyl-CoA synthetase beta subunit